MRWFYFRFQSAFVRGLMDDEALAPSLQAAIDQYRETHAYASHQRITVLVNHKGGHREVATIIA